MTDADLVGTCVSYSPTILIGVVVVNLIFLSKYLDLVDACHRPIVAPACIRRVVRHAWWGLSIIASEASRNTKGPGGPDKALIQLGVSVYQPCKETGQMIPDKFASDLRDLGPTHICTCGCNVFKSLIAFEDYEISWWYLEGECLNCGNKVTLPCPADKPE